MRGRRWPEQPCGRSPGRGKGLASLPPGPGGVGKPNPLTRTATPSLTAVPSLRYRDLGRRPVFRPVQVDVNPAIRGCPMPKLVRFLVASLTFVSWVSFPRTPYVGASSTICGPGVSKVATVENFYARLNGASFAIAAGGSRLQDLHQAYSCYSTAFQAHVGYTTWVKGYVASMHTQTISLPKLLPNGTVAISILATDARDGHREFTRFAGTWSLVQQNGWRLDTPRVHLVSQQPGPSLDFHDDLLASLVQYSFKSPFDLPVSLPFADTNISWQQAPIEGGTIIILARGAPISNANTIFTETITKAFVPTAGVDSQVTLANRARAFYYAPAIHGGNGQPQLTWSRDHQAYQITFACRSGCLKGLIQIADSMAPFYDSWG